MTSSLRKHDASVTLAYMATGTNDKLMSVQARIRENAARYFPRFSGQPVDIRVRRLRTGSNPLYHCRLHPKDRQIPSADVIVKFAPKPLQIEFDNLRLFEQARHEAPHGLAAPRPLDYFQDINALLTEKVGGRPLSQLVLRNLHVFASPAARESVAAKLKLCGSWLAHYHRLTRCRDAAPFDERWMAQVVARADELDRIGFPRHILDTSRKLFSRLHDLGTRHLAPYAYKHGDFGFHNVNAGDDWVCVFDLNDHRPVCVYQDLALFLVTLETKNNWPWYPLFDRRAASAMKTCFLDGYFAASRNCAPVLLESHTLARLVVHCAKQRRSVGARSRLLLPVFDAVQLRRFYAPRILRQCELVEQVLADEVNRTTIVRNT